MKNIWKYAIVALAGLSLFACNKEIEQPENDAPAAETYSYTITIADETKTVLDGNHIAWEDGDQVAWHAISGTYHYNGYSDVIISNPCYFKVRSDRPINAGGNLYACSNCNGIDNSGVAEFVIPTEQDGTVIKNAMPMVSMPIVIPSNIPATNTDTSIGLAQFANLGSVIEYNVYTNDTAYGDEKVKSVKFTADSPVAGDFDVDLTTVSETNIPTPSGIAETTVKSTLGTPATVGAGKTAGTKVYQVVAPGTVSGTILVSTDKATYSYTLPSSEFKRSKVKTINVDLASANATRTDLTLIENKLTANTWVLKDVKEAGVSVTTSTGNKLTFNSGNTMTFDCTANGGETYDHTWVGGMIAPDAYGDVADMRWSVSAEGGKNYLIINNGFPLVFAQDNTLECAYEITELSDSKLTLENTIEYSWGPETWTLVYEADGYVAGPIVYHHDFALGDWGIGSDSTGHPYGDYYFDWGLVNPDVLDGASWTWSQTNNGNSAYDAGGYFEYLDWPTIQIGSYSTKISDYILSSNSFSGAITRVSLCFEVDGTIDVSCKVGGSAFGSAVTGFSSGTVEFTGNASGTIEITLHSSDQTPAWLYNVEVEYDPSATPI